MTRRLETGIKRNLTDTHIRSFQQFFRLLNAHGLNINTGCLTDDGMQFPIQLRTTHPQRFAEVVRIKSVSINIRKNQKIDLLKKNSIFRMPGNKRSQQLI